MFREPSGLSREAHLFLALVSIVLAAGCVVIAATSQSGVFGCPTCTTYDWGQDTVCNGNQPTYCGGGLPFLSLMIFTLTALCYLFGLNGALSSRRNWWADGMRTPQDRWPFSSVARRTLGLFLAAEGGGLLGVGAGMPAARFCIEPCSAYTLSGIPLLLVLLGVALLTVAGTILLPSLGRAIRARRARPHPPTHHRRWSATTRRRALWTLGAAVVLGVVLAFLLPAIIPPGGGLLSHQECLRGAGTNTISVWTPLVVANAPQHGYVDAMSNGSLYPWNSLQAPELNVSDGSSAVLMAQINWTIYPLREATVSGPGWNVACHQPDQLVAASGGAPVECTLQGASNASDQNISTSSPVAGCPFLGSNSSARFPDAFNATFCPAWQAEAALCALFGYPPEGWGVGSDFSNFAVALPILSAGAISWVAATVPQTVSVSYFSNAPGCWHPQYIDTAPGSIGWLAWGPYTANSTLAACPSDS